MNVNENLRRQLTCASKRNSLLIAQTPSERKSLKILVAGGAAIEPIPGAFSLKEEYEHMNPRARERARIRAIHRLHPDWTFCLYSAAIAHGLQVPHALLDATHIAIAKGRNWRKAEPTIHSHVLHDPITTTSDGVPCTNISATVFECLCATDFRLGLAIVDSALHNHLVSRETLIDYFEQHARYRHGSRRPIRPSYMQTAEARTVANPSCAQLFWNWVLRNLIYKSKSKTPSILAHTSALTTIGCSKTDA